MNHITRLMTERDEARAVIRDARQRLTELELYLTSAKFQGLDADYVNVRTDILPKLSSIRFDLCGQ